MHYPQILSWLSTRAGVDEAKGKAIWDSIVAEAAIRYTKPEIGSATYWDDVVTELHRRMAIEASRNGCENWQVTLPEVPQFTALLDFQTKVLTRLMLGWRDMALASTRPWRAQDDKDLAA